MNEPDKRDKKTKRSDFLSHIKEAARDSAESRRGVKEAPVLDVAVFVIALLFARCHVIFGSHPIALGWLAILPSRVWLALIGACVGAFSLGKSGAIYLITSAVVVILRLITSMPDKQSGKTEAAHRRGAFFKEGLLLRTSAAVIGGFVAAVYEVLISGFSFTSVLYGLAMIILPPAAAFAFSGLFDTGIGFKDIFSSRSPIFSPSLYRGDGKKYSPLFFQGSALVLIFLLSFSMRDLEFFGITFSYILAGALTLFTAKRFGSVRAAAVGFAATVALSPAVSAAFALGGLVAGALFKLGFAYALIGSAGAIAAFSAYSGGLMGFLSAFPEFAISSMLASPIIARLPKDSSQKSSENSPDTAIKDLVGSLALAYQNGFSGAVDSLEVSLLEMSRVLECNEREDLFPCLEELTDIVADCTDKHCSSCREAGFGCPSRAIIRQSSRRIAEKIERSGGASASDLNRLGIGVCAEMISDAITRAVAAHTEERYKISSKNTRAEDFELTSRLISESRLADLSEKSLDAEATAAAEGVMTDMGLVGGAAVVFGRRKKHVILAAADGGGEKISSPKLKERIESALSVRLGNPVFYKKGYVAMMECSAAEALSAEISTLTKSGKRDEISGDNAKHTRSTDGRFISVISDGMGSGECAAGASKFVTDFITDATGGGAPTKIVVRLLNNAVRRRAGECTATLDLCSLDLYNGECVFLKCGAPPSYIKRGNSIFRIRASTAPLGVLRVTDAEAVTEKVLGGDFIISFSDGIVASGDDEPWLLELLSSTGAENPESLAEEILDAASRQDLCEDDMTVSVIKVNQV